MSLVKRPPLPPEKQTIGIRLEVAVIEKLKRYAEYLGGDVSYVVSERLKQLFDKDTNFQTWLKTHPSFAVETESSRDGSLRSDTHSVISGT